MRFRRENKIEKLNAARHESAAAFVNRVIRRFAARHLQRDDDFTGFYAQSRQSQAEYNRAAD